MNRPTPEPAAQPDDLGRLFVERANAGDVDGLLALYEADAILAFPPGQVTRGRQEIRQVFVDFVASHTKLTPGEPRPTLQVGDLALTSSRVEGDVTAEVARRQPDGTWRWVIDQPNVLGRPAA